MKNIKSFFDHKLNYFNFLPIISLFIFILIFFILSHQLQNQIETIRQLKSNLNVKEINFKNNSFQLERFQKEEKNKTQPFQRFQRSSFNKPTRPYDLEKIIQAWQKNQKISLVQWTVYSIETFNQSPLLHKANFSITVKSTHLKAINALIQDIVKNVPGIFTIESLNYKNINDINDNQKKTVSRKKNQNKIDVCLKISWIYLS